MRAYAEQSAPFTPEALRHLDQCIVCRNCETVCPSGIRMGAMMESFRHEMDSALPRKPLRQHAAKLLLRAVIPHRHRIAALTDLLYLYERSGLRRLVRGLGRRRWLRRLGELDHLLPPMVRPRDRRIDTDEDPSGGLYPATGRARMRVALFLGCITSQWFTGTHRSTIRMLNRAGCDVFVPGAQTCCGALHRHAGMMREGCELFARNAEVFANAEADVVVVNAAGCGAALREPPPDVPGGREIEVRDVCEFLEEIGIPAPDVSIPRKVAYDQPCHLLHGQRVPESAVLNLLGQIPGLELVPLADSDRCCGAGGVYNLLHPEMAEPIRADKVRAILDSGADVVVTGNPGCWLQIRSGLVDTQIEVLHPVDLLDRAYSTPRR
jgi:glycolate oxidase iron-sulfur subunit